MNFKELGKYLQEHVEYIYFNCVFTCTYGDSWVESCRGKSRQFIMWKDIIIWESGILEINPGVNPDTAEGRVLTKIFELLDVEFIHALGTNEFDKIKDYYKIKGIKFQDIQESGEIEIIEEIDDLEELEEVVDEEIIDTEEVEDDDLDYIIRMNLKEQYIEIEKHYMKDIKNGFKVFGE